MSATDIDENQKASLITYHCIQALCVATSLLFSYITYRVVKISKCSDPIFIIMLTLLQLSLVANILFFQFQVRIIKSDIDNPNIPWTTYYCSNATYTFAPAILLALATVLNTSKWIYFNWRVKNLKYLDLKDEKQILLAQNALLVKQRRLNIATGLIFIVIITTSIYYMALGCSASYK